MPLRCCAVLLAAFHGTPLNPNAKDALSRAVDEGAALGAVLTHARITGVLTRQFLRG